MPFAAEFEEIYDHFIADALREAGFTVQRADDFRNQRNILQDVVAGISLADLIVADLTGANPNVYYELGVAHALRRRVVLLTQSIEQLPFDLRSYRVITYNTHFAAIRSARQNLLSVAKGAIDGSINFSSPVADYLPHDPNTFGDMEGGLRQEDDDEEPGFLDHMVRLEEGFSALGRVLTSIGERTTEINEHTNRLTEKLPRAYADKTPGNATRTRDLVRGYSDQLSAYARALSSSVTEYQARLNDTQGALEAIVSAQTPSTDEEREQLREFLRVLEGLEDQAFQGRTSFAGLADSMAQVPRLEKRLDRARKEAISQLRGLVARIDDTSAMISRGKTIGARVLRASGPHGHGSDLATT